MATVQGSLEQPLEEAAATIRAAAGSQGWALHEGLSSRGRLVFKKGVRVLSWGSELRVQLEPASPLQTHVSIETGETFAITDWGRGKRAARALLHGAGAGPA